MPPRKQDGLLGAKQAHAERERGTPTGRKPNTERKEAAAAEQEQQGVVARVPHERRDGDPGGDQDRTGRQG
jgi:hypothetical protein